MNVWDFGLDMTRIDFAAGYRDMGVYILSLGLAE
jgi:hypothetical protein